MAKSLLAGLPPEAKKRIREEIRIARKEVNEGDNQQYDELWTNLSSLKKELNVLVDKAKTSGKVPKGTNLTRLDSIPTEKPPRWPVLFRRIFGRKRTSASTASTIKKTAPKKKVNPKKKR